MSSVLCLFLIIRISVALAAPIQFPLIQPLQGTLQQQRLALQEQMFALQQFQALQRMNLVPSPVPMNPQPILVIYPNKQADKPDVRRTDYNANLKYHKQEVEGDEDSEVINADPEENDSPKSSIRAILLMPNSRGFVGDFISGISWLPFEINVPDSISWIYNGIAGIIGGIGQRWPFQPQMVRSETENGGIKSVLNQILSEHGQIGQPDMPIVMIPLGQPMFPMQM